MLGSGGLLGNSAALNQLRDQAEQDPRKPRPRTSASALGMTSNALTANASGALSAAQGMKRIPTPPGRNRTAAR